MKRPVHRQTIQRQTTLSLLQDRVVCLFPVYGGDTGHHCWIVATSASTALGTTMRQTGAIRFDGELRGPVWVSPSSAHWRGSPPGFGEEIDQQDE